MLNPPFSYDNWRRHLATHLNPTFSCFACKRHHRTQLELDSHRECCVKKSLLINGQQYGGAAAQAAHVPDFQADKFYLYKSALGNGSKLYRLNMKDNVAPAVQVLANLRQRITHDARDVLTAEIEQNPSLGYKYYLTVSATFKKASTGELTIPPPNFNSEVHILLPMVVSQDLADKLMLCHNNFLLKMHNYTSRGSSWVLTRFFYPLKNVENGV